VTAVPSQALSVENTTGIDCPEVTAMIGARIEARVPAAVHVTIEELTADDGRPLHMRLIPGRMRHAGLAPMALTDAVVRLRLSVRVVGRDRPMTLVGRTSARLGYEQALDLARSRRPWSGYHLGPGRRDPWTALVEEALANALALTPH
jgi:hypothetical protein